MTTAERMILTYNIFQYLFKWILYIRILHQQPDNQIPGIGCWIWIHISREHQVFCLIDKKRNNPRYPHIASHSFTSAYEEGVDFRHVHMGAGAERWINWYINSLSSEHLIISSLLSSWSHSRLSDYSSSAYQLWKSLILPTNHPPTTMDGPATPPLPWPWKPLDQMPIQLSDHLCIIDAGRVVAALVHHKHFAR